MTKRRPSLRLGEKPALRDPLPWPVRLGIGLVWIGVAALFTWGFPLWFRDSSVMRLVWASGTTLGAALDLTALPPGPWFAPLPQALWWLLYQFFGMEFAGYQFVFLLLWGWAFAACFTSVQRIAGYGTAFLALAVGLIGFGWVAAQGFLPSGTDLALSALFLFPAVSQWHRFLLGQSGWTGGIILGLLATLCFPWAGLVPAGMIIFSRGIRHPFAITWRAWLYLIALAVYYSLVEPYLPQRFIPSYGAEFGVMVDDIYRRPLVLAFLFLLMLGRMRIFHRYWALGLALILTFVAWHIPLAGWVCTWIAALTGTPFEAGLGLTVLCLGLLARFIPIPGEVLLVVTSLSMVLISALVWTKPAENAWRKVREYFVRNLWVPVPIAFGLLGVILAMLLIPWGPGKAISDATQSARAFRSAFRWMTLSTSTGAAIGLVRESELPDSLKVPVFKQGFRDRLLYSRPVTPEQLNALLGLYRRSDLRVVNWSAAPAEPGPNGPRLWVPNNADRTFLAFWASVRYLALNPVAEFTFPPASQVIAEMDSNAILVAQVQRKVQAEMARQKAVKGRQKDGGMEGQRDRGTEENPSQIRPGGP